MYAKIIYFFQKKVIDASCKYILKSKYLQHTFGLCVYNLVGFIYSRGATIPANFIHFCQKETAGIFYFPKIVSGAATKLHVSELGLRFVL